MPRNNPPALTAPLPWVTITSLINILSCLGLAYTQWQINQAESQYPAGGTTNSSAITAQAPQTLAADKHYGVSLDLTQYSAADQPDLVAELARLGFKWLRQPFDWALIEPQPGQYKFRRLDTAITTARAEGLHIIAVLQNSPPWAREAGTAQPGGAKAPPLEATDFGRFAQIVARRYSNQINHYQIWHEPNINQVEAQQYTHLLKNAAITIRAENPQAKILSAALAPNTAEGPANLNEMAYLKAMYEAEAAPWFDILAGQLYGFHLPVEPVERDPQLLNIHRVTYLREIMQANQDGHKPIWATAFGWNALPPDWGGRPSPWPTDNPTKQRRRTAEAIAYARANWPWLGPMLAIRWDTQGLSQDDPARGFAIKPALITPFEEAAQNQTKRATVGAYTAQHESAQYYGAWRRAKDRVDPPKHNNTLLGHPIYPTMTLNFEGTRLDLTIDRGRFQGYLRVKVDGQPSDTLPKDEQGQSYITLYDPLIARDTLTLARYLPDGPHEVLIQAEGGWGQWVISGWQVYREADTRRLRLGLVVMVSLAVLSGFAFVRQVTAPAMRPYRRRLWAYLLSSWERLEKGYAKLKLRGQIILTFGLVIAYSLLPEASEHPIPWPDFLLPLLVPAFILRPDIGLMVLSFGISFFLLPKTSSIGPIFIFEVCLMILALATVAHILIQRQLHQTKPRASLNLRSLDWAVIALLGLGIINTLYIADNKGAALHELRTVIFGSVLFYALIRLISKIETSPCAHIHYLSGPNLIPALIDAFVAGAFVHANTALFQYIFQPEQTIAAQGVLRAIGYLYGSPNNLALFLERVMPILIAVCFFGTGKFRRGFYTIALVVVSAALYLTYSMGSLLLALPAGVLFMTLLKGGRRGWLGAGVGLTLLGLILLPIANTERFLSVFRVQPGSTLFFRLKLWQSTLTMLSERPFNGVGLDNFLYHYRTRYILPAAWADPNLSHPHNLILDFAVRLGLWGVLLLLWLQWQFWSSAIQTYRALQESTLKAMVLGLMGSMITFLAHGLVDNSYFLVDLAFTFFLTLSLIETAKGAGQPSSQVAESLNR